MFQQEGLEKFMKAAVDCRKELNASDGKFVSIKFSLREIFYFHTKFSFVF